MHTKEIPLYFEYYISSPVILSFFRPKKYCKQRKKTLFLLIHEKAQTLHISTEAEGSRETTQHGIMSSFAGGGLEGR
jgi:hypothetical protein